MARLPLIGGSYSARSIIANCQRCINLFPELNPRDSLVPVTHYQRPGIFPLAFCPTPGAGRGVFLASNGKGYAVVGQNVYYIAPNFSFNLIGRMESTATTPTSFVDNGIQGMLVDGSPFGYIIDVVTNKFNQLVDLSGSFTGADRVDVIDGFILWNYPGTNKFGSTLFDEISFDPLYIAAKTAYPDVLQSLIVNKHEVLLIGSVRSEVWYDAGLANFPFAELPGAYFEHGTAAKYSVAAQDISVYWLSADRQGQGMVFRARGYEAKRISNHALEYQIRLMAEAGTIADAIGYTHQFDGHTFYVLTFPTGDQTWTFDETTDQWSQRAWTDANGNLHRDRLCAFAYLYGKSVGMDWETGTLYEVSPKYYSDVLVQQAMPISFIRTFPHIGTGELNLGAPGATRPVSADGRRVKFTGFQADIEAGTAPLDSNGLPGKVVLRWSDDRGRTFGNDMLQSLGTPGQWLSQPQWLGLGIARDRIFELEYSVNAPAALNGAWVEGEVLVT